MQYDFRKIEKKWQKFWHDHCTFKSEVIHNKPKYYILDMFPYPSGSGLHVGHVTGYTATDIIARYKRQKGFNVLHPMGWDSFGLPAEQYAIRTGTHPKISTEENIKTYKSQLQSLGLSYDWDREIATSDPEYYKWTQWIFTILYKKGLAYEAELMVNFCPKLGTVLANEEVEEGRSKEGGYPVEKRPLRQWVLKITSYADQLLEDLSLLDWPESLKKLQANWIGRSEGAKISFQTEKEQESISVYTTCPETLFGVTYLVLAPEHPLVMKLLKESEREKVIAFLKQVSLKSDRERGDDSKEKEGIDLGAFALHPITGKKIPIWIADYVLYGYGTGAVMGVPSHDERDFVFAKKYKLPLHVVIEPSEFEQDKKEALFSHELSLSTKEGTVINSSSSSLSLDGLSVAKAFHHVIDWLEQHDKGEKCIHYKLRDWLFSRQRYWGEPFPILHFEDGSKRVLELDELPLCPPYITDFSPSDKGMAPLAKERQWVEITDTKTGKKALRETNVMPQWAGSCWYYLRFCDPKNSQEAWNAEKEKYWMPVDLYVGGVEHAVLHLLYARFWHKVLYDAGLVSTKEPFQMLRNQGLVTAFAYQKTQGGYYPSEGIEEKNGEFFFKGEKVVAEKRLEKMSKSKLNGVSPDEMIQEYGADALRLYEMFMGPFEKEKLWNSDAVNGCKRFLNRFHDLVFSEKVIDTELDEATQLAHELVFHVERALEHLSFNTAIAKLMEFINSFIPLEFYPRSALKMATQVLYPFAPHLAEEAWQRLGSVESLTYIPFPQAEEKYLVKDQVLIVVQVNGKVRGKWNFPRNMNQEQILEEIEKQPQIKKYLSGNIEKVVYVPNKLLNFVVN